MTRIGTLARDALALAAPYWRSEERWRARLLLATVIGLNLALVAVTVELTYWQRAFFNALEARDWPAFIALLFWWRQTADGWVPSFALIAAAFVPLTMYELYLRQALQIRWRRWLTDEHVDRWLRDRTYYRLVLADEGVDNPDQRIAEDIRLFVNDTLNLGLGLMRAVVALLSFIIVLWTMSEPVTVWGITVHGYLVWAALLFSVAGTVLTHLVGRRLIDLTYIEQKAEADFRFGLTRLRENAESVAFHEGEQDEKRQSVNRFTAIATNWLGIMRVTR
ncbi:MAG: ABC transporter ATP-binding protein/permease, partial [Burkholderiales bacterium]|nr:ABC transporter ATP-binding protein/permease [Burkholderiales bacterium]